MNRQIEKKLATRAVELGNAGNGQALPELANLLKKDSAEVRRLAASAIGKLAGASDPVTAVAELISALKDSHPQVRQYAIKALKAYGANAKPALHDLKDIADNVSEKEYNQRDAKLAIEIIEETLRIRDSKTVKKCQRCSAQVSADEYARSHKAFQRVFCDKCFDEVYLERRNFDTKVELNKMIRTKDGTLVQSDGERIISECLAAWNIAYRYDERFRIVDGFAIRPDFYLPEFDVYVEYWGMNTADYKIGMLKKQKLYQQEGKKVVSLSFTDKRRLKEVLRAKLSKYLKVPGVDES